MRREEKGVTEREILDRIIQGSAYCHLACCQDDRPYLIPISFGYDGQAIYIHTAPEGKKILIFERNPQVSLSFVCQAELITHPQQACQWSFGFSSVFAEGEICELTDIEDKRYALNQIMAHYSGHKWEIPESRLSGTRVWKIPLKNISGKISPAPSR